MVDAFFCELIEREIDEIREKRDGSPQKLLQSYSIKISIDTYSVRTFLGQNVLRPKCDSDVNLIASNFRHLNHFYRFTICCAVSFLDYLHQIDSLNFDIKSLPMISGLGKERPAIVIQNASASFSRFLKFNSF